MKKANLNSLRAIRIVKDISIKNMAEAFGVTAYYISCVENGERKFGSQTLKYGLDNINVSLDKYNELEDFRILLSNSNIKEENKFLLFLIKTSSITKKELNKEETISKYINDSTDYEKEIDDKIQILQEQIQLLQEQVDSLNSEKGKIKKRVNQ